MYVCVHTVQDWDRYTCIRVDSMLRYLANQTVHDVVSLRFSVPFELILFCFTSFRFAIVLVRVVVSWCRGVVASSFSAPSYRVALSFSTWLSVFLFPWLHVRVKSGTTDVTRCFGHASQQNCVAGTVSLGHPALN